MFSIPHLNWAYNAHVLISTSSSVPVNTSLSIPGFDFERINIITNTTHADVALPISPDVRIYRGEGKRNKTIIVKSSGIVNVHAVDNKLCCGDGFVVLPTEKLGKKYHVASFKTI